MAYRRRRRSWLQFFRDQASTGFILLGLVVVLGLTRATMNYMEKKYEEIARIDSELKYLSLDSNAQRYLHLSRARDFARMEPFFIALLVIPFIGLFIAIVFILFLKANSRGGESISSEEALAQMRAKRQSVEENRGPREQKVTVLNLDD